MIYAKIVGERKSANGSNLLLVHFYGKQEITDKLTDNIRTLKTHPLSYLAETGFTPVSDDFFILDESIANI